MNLHKSIFSIHNFLADSASFRVAAQISFQEWTNFDLKDSSEPQDHNKGTSEGAESIKYQKCTPTIRESMATLGRNPYSKTSIKNPMNKSFWRTKIKPFHNDQGYVWRKRGEAFNQKSTILTTKHGGGSIMSGGLLLEKGLVQFTKLMTSWGRRIISK